MKFTNLPLLGISPDHCDGFYPRSITGHCQGCGVASVSASQHIDRHTFNRREGRRKKHESKQAL